MAAPNGEPSAAWFEWGARGGYAQTSPVTAIAAGTGVVRVSTGIIGLSNGRAYQCRLVVSNASGWAYGAPQLFTTGSRIVGWGFNSPAQTTPPAGLNDAVEVSIGNAHAVALKADRTVIAWGYNGYGQTSVPGDLTNALAVAAGGNHTVAIRPDGTAIAWGLNDSGQINVPAGLSNVIAIAAGWAHSIALKSDGAVVAWGGYYAGSTLIPITVPPGLSSNVVAIASGSSHALALKADSTVVVWGDNTYGQTNLPSGLSNIVAVAGGGYHTVALKTDGTVTAWGFNNYNQTNTPGDLSDVVGIAAGTATSMAVRSNGTAASWGLYTAGWLPSGLGNVVALTAAADNLALGERAPRALAGTALALWGQDLVVGLNAEDAESDPFTCLIVAIPAKGKLYQYGANGLRGAQISTNGTLVADLQHRVIFAAETNDFANPYTTFGFVANDGQLNSDPATVTINMLPPAPYLDGAKCRMHTNGQFELNFSGQSNATYRVWTSTDLKNWQPAGTAAVTTNGWFQFIFNPGQDKSTRRFFRAGVP